MKNVTKKKPGNKRSDSVSREEFFAEFGTLLEDIRNNGLIVAEGVTSLRNELRMEIADVRQEMRSGFLAVGESLELLHDEVKDIKKELAIVKKELTNKADVDRVDSLEERVRRVEITILKRKSIPA